MRALLVGFGVLWCGCASVPVHRMMVGGELLPAHLHDLQEPAGQCRPDRWVTVVDAAERPVPGARVIATQRVSDQAGEEPLSVYVYSADPVATDARGRAKVCNPGALDPPGAFEGMGGGSSFRGRGQILVFAPRTSGSPPLNAAAMRTAQAVLLPPFDGDLRATLSAKR